MVEFENNLLMNEQTKSYLNIFCVPREFHIFLILRERNTYYKSIESVIKKLHQSDVIRLQKNLKK